MIMDDGVVLAVLEIGTRGGMAVPTILFGSYCSVTSMPVISVSS
jgi:hypothetical protein